MVKESVKIRTGVSARFLAVAQLLIGLLGLLGGGWAWTNANFASKEALTTETEARVIDTKEINKKLDIIIRTLLERK